MYIIKCFESSNFNHNGIVSFTSHIFFIMLDKYNLAIEKPLASHRMGQLATTIEAEQYL